MPISNNLESQQCTFLDNTCGSFLTYRQLIECGETQAATGQANLPNQPDSYTALLDLARFVIDPVIKYFGMITLTYGFCSRELAKAIPGRIAPKLDQHAAHEFNTRKQAICQRLGAAVHGKFVLPLGYQAAAAAQAFFVIRR